MTTYCEHQAKQGRRDEVALDVIELDQPIEVQSRVFESKEDLEAHIARETGRAP